MFLPASEYCSRQVESQSRIREKIMDNFFLGPFSPVMDGSLDSDEPPDLGSDFGPPKAFSAAANGLRLAPAE